MISVNATEYAEYRRLRDKAAELNRQIRDNNYTVRTCQELRAERQRVTRQITAMHLRLHYGNVTAIGDRRYVNHPTDDRLKNRTESAA